MIPGWLIIHELVHLLIGLAVGGVLWKWSGDRRAFIIAVLTSMFIDIDHLLDYSLVWWPKLGDIIIRGTNALKAHIFILFHSWEITALLIAFGIGFRKNKWGIVCLSVGAAMLGHITMDKIWYGTPWELYLLSLRIYHHFLVPNYW